MNPSPTISMKGDITVALPNLEVNTRVTAIAAFEGRHFADPTSTATRLPVTGVQCHVSFSALSSGLRTSHQKKKGAEPLVSLSLTPIL